MLQYGLRQKGFMDTPTAYQISYRFNHLFLKGRFARTCPVFNFNKVLDSIIIVLHVNV